MRIVILMSAVIVGVAAMSLPASAQNYPWCAHYAGGGGGGGRNCGFETRAQCMATVSGIGGFCAHNTQYRPGHRRQ
jgi:hypothetical protein